MIISQIQIDCSNAWYRQFVAPCLTEVKVMRIQITLECTQCKRRNYVTFKNKKNTTARLEIKKYCRWDRKHTVHKETK